MRVEFNVNDKVRVVLTAAGAEHYYRHFSDVPGRHLPQLYAGSEWEGPVWELMQIWGAVMFNGQLPSRMPFQENTIELQGGK